jgi:hypothetical protein
MQQIFSKLWYISFTLPKNYDLFPALKNMLEGHKYQDYCEVQIAVIQSLLTQGKGFGQQGIGQINASSVVKNVWKIIWVTVR